MHIQSIYMYTYVHVHIYRYRHRTTLVGRLLLLKVSFRKRATNYGTLLRKMTCKDEASYSLSLPCMYIPPCMYIYTYTDIDIEPHSFIASSSCRIKQALKARWNA